MITVLGIGSEGKSVVSHIPRIDMILYTYKVKIQKNSWVPFTLWESKNKCHFFIIHKYFRHQAEAHLIIEFAFFLFHSGFISRVSSLTFRGVPHTEDLKWSWNATCIINMALQRLLFLRTPRCDRHPRRLLISLYCCTIQSILIYCCIYLSFYPSIYLSQ